MNKYHNKKIEADGMVFDSSKEYQRWQMLSLLSKNGKIKNLRRQVEFELIPAQREPISVGSRKGKLLERACKYRADFVYERDGKMVVEDTKGVRTQAYIIKRKLMLQVYGIQIREI